MATVVASAIYKGDRSTLKTGRKFNINGAEKEYFPIDSLLLERIDDFYESIEELFGICRRTQFNLIFKGGIKLKKQDQKRVENLLKIAFDHKKKFGFCPVKRVKREVSRKKDNKKKAEYLESIPIFGTGVFFYRVKYESDLQIEMIFIPLKNEDGTDNEDLKLDPNIYVYIWPGTQPSKKGWIKSEVLNLMQRYYELRQLNRNFMHADYDQSHPSCCLETRKDPNAGDVTKMTDQELLQEQQADDEQPIQLPPRLNQQVINDNYYKAQIEANQSMMKEMNRDNTYEESYDASKKQFEHCHNKRNWEENFLFVPDNLQIARQVVATSSTKYFDKLERYIDHIFMVMGVPPRYVTGGKSFKTDSQNELHFLQSSIQGFRDDLQDFWQETFYTLHSEQKWNHYQGKIDSLSLKDKDQIEKRSPRELIHDPDTKKQKLVQKQDVIRNREFKLEFNEDPFKSNIQTPDVVLAINQNVLSPVELTNLIRTRVRLSPLLETDEIVKKVKELRDEAIKLALMQTKLQQQQPVKPGNGGSSSAKPKDSAVTSPPKRKQGVDEDKVVAKKKKTDSTATATSV